MELTKDILNYFRLTPSGVSLEQALEFKSVISSKVLKKTERTGFSNYLHEILVELEDTSSTKWFMLDQGWGGGDDADNWVYLYSSLEQANKEYNKFNS